MYFQRLSLSQIADFEVHQSGNVDQKDYVKAPLFLFIKIAPVFTWQNLIHLAA